LKKVYKKKKQEEGIPFFTLNKVKCSFCAWSNVAGYELKFGFREFSMEEA